MRSPFSVLLFFLLFYFIFLFSCFAFCFWTVPDRSSASCAPSYENQNTSIKQIPCSLMLLWRASGGRVTSFLPLSLDDARSQFTPLMSQTAVSCCPSSAPAFWLTVVRIFSLRPRELCRLNPVSGPSGLFALPSVLPPRGSNFVLRPFRASWCSPFTPKLASLRYSKRFFYLMPLQKNKKEK